MYLPKGTITTTKTPLVKNGLIVFKELMLKWRIRFAPTQNCVNVVCFV